MGIRFGADPTLRARELARVFDALADEGRLKIVFLLATRGGMSVAELVEELGQTNPTVGRHLARLRGVGLIDVRRDGKLLTHSLDPNGISALLGRVFPPGTTRVVPGVEIVSRPE